MMPLDMWVYKRFILPTSASLRKYASESEVLFVYAIIETGGKQYKVSEGDIVFIEKLEAAEGETYTFDKVLVVSGDETVFGSPYVEGANVTATVVKNGKSKKIYVMTYKAKKNEKRKLGHRQPYTKVQIQAISR